MRYMVLIKASPESEAGRMPSAADELTDEPSLEAYHLLPSVRADLLAKLGRHAEAKAEFERAAGMTSNARERKLLLERAGRMTIRPS